MAKILLVEDDKTIVSGLTSLLNGEGFGTDSASGQREALRKAEAGDFDLVLLDISLSDGNGFSVCSALRERWDLPVIFLTASEDEFSAVAGLDIGADDYIVKPFRPRELVSRIRSVLRRTGRAATVLEWGGLRIDPGRGTVSRDGGEIFLSALEYRLLLAFANHSGMLLTRDQLLEEIWDASGEYVNDNTLTVYIKRLRNKIEPDPAEPRLIRTVRGIGYKSL